MKDHPKRYLHLVWMWKDSTEVAVHRWEGTRK